MALSTSALVGVGLFRSKQHKEMTIPGVQNPHCIPCIWIKLFYKKPKPGYEEG